MINKDRIDFNVARYYIPGFNGPVTVSVQKVFSDGNVLVKPYDFNKDLKAFPIPIEHVYNKEEHARIGKRAWEHYIRQKKKQKKVDKKNDTRTAAKQSHKTATAEN